MNKTECEAYVRGMFDLYWMIGGETHCKSYDPLTFDETDEIAHSYVLDLEDGGRHHRYVSVDDVADRALLELATTCINDMLDDDGTLGEWNDYFKEQIEARIKARKKESE